MFTLVAVSMISSVSAVSKKDAILGFTRGCFNPNPDYGYFGTSDNTTAKMATLESTYAALNVIRILGGTQDRTSEISQFLGSLSNATQGGFRNVIDAAGSEAVVSTFKALHIRQTLNINTSKSELNEHAEFLLDSQNENGGFGSSPSTNSSPDIFNTYYALKALSITGNLTKVNMTLVHNFTMSCREAGNVFAGTWNSTDVSIVATYFAIRLFKDYLTSENDLDGTANDVRAFIASHQDSSGGFVDPAMGTSPLLSSTYYAAAICRDFAGDIPGGDDDKVITWILSRQGYDGGFIEGSSPLATSSMPATDLAVSAIYRIRPTLSDLTADTAWTLSQIAGIVAAVVLIIAIVVLIFAAYIVKRRNRI